MKITVLFISVTFFHGEYLLALIFIIVKIQFFERNSEGHTQINMRPLDLGRRTAKCKISYLQNEVQNYTKF